MVDLNDCVKGGVQGELSVAAAIRSSCRCRPDRRCAVASAAGLPDDKDTVATAYHPGTRLAVTIPTVDPRRGRMMGLVVQMLTLVKDQNGELHDLPHAGGRSS